MITDYDIAMVCLLVFMAGLLVGIGGVLCCQARATAKKQRGYYDE